MRLGWVKTGAALSGAAALLVAQAATAADMPSYYMPSESYAPAPPPVEFGTGWYLRGDASFGPEDMPKLVLQDNAPTFSRKGSGFGYAVGGGAGYQFTDHLRADVTGDYLDPLSYGATQSCGLGCSLTARSTVQRWDGLVNGYYDVGTWAGLTPYLGAGVGIAGTHVRDRLTTSADTVSTVTLPAHTDYRFAWAAMAGVSYAVAPHLLFDIGYRYLDLGKATIPVLPTLSATRSITEQQVRLGLRYMVD